MNRINLNIVFYIVFAVVLLIAVFVITLFIRNSSHVYSINVLLAANSMSAANSPFYQFQTSYFNIQINNTGSNYIRGMLLGFYLNHTLIEYYNVSLPPHKGAAVSTNYTYNKSGKYNFEIDANPSQILTFSINIVWAARS